jgi:hypothetical protein
MLILALHEMTIWGGGSRVCLLYIPFHFPLTPAGEGYLGCFRSRSDNVSISIRLTSFHGVIHPVPLAQTNDPGGFSQDNGYPPSYGRIQQETEPKSIILHDTHWSKKVPSGVLSLKFHWWLARTTGRILGVVDYLKLLLQALHTNEDEIPIHQIHSNEIRGLLMRKIIGSILGEFDECSTNYILAPWKLPFIIHPCNVAIVWDYSLVGYCLVFIEDGGVIS